MKIDSKIYVGADDQELIRVREDMFKHLDEDQNISTSDGFKDLIKIIYDDYTSFKKYLFTESSMETVHKIKITEKDVPYIINQVCDSKFRKYSEQWCWDQMAIFLFKGGFYKWVSDSVAKALYFFRIYLDTLPENDHQTYFYTVWRLKADQIGVLHHHVIELLQMLVYWKMSEPTIQVIDPRKKIGTRKKGFYNSTPSQLIIVDKNWNVTSVRSGEFDVGGHFRLQPCGKGREERKLIWIKPFKKNGYIRKARRKIT